MTDLRFRVCSASGLALTLIVLFMRETRTPVILTRRAKKLDTGVVGPYDAFHAHGDFILILTFVP